MTHRQIINRALLALGIKPITGAIGTTDPVHIAVDAAYEAAWREVLECNAWSDLLVLDELDADTDDDDECITDDEGNYRFTVPTDSVRVIGINGSDGKDDWNAKKRGAYIFSASDTITLTYVSGDGLVPVDIDDIDTVLEPPTPSVLLDAVAYRLASLIAFTITQNTGLQSALETRYYNALSQAKMHDMRAEGGEDFWGTASANSSLEEID